MSSKATRSLNAVQAVRASVADKVRRNDGSGSSSAKQGPMGQRPKPKQPAVGSGSSSTRKPTHLAKAPGKQKGKTPRAVEAPRSTRVVIARVDPFSVLKLSVVFYLSLALALFVAGVILWTVARSSGLVANIESLVADVGFTDFRLRTGPLLGASALASAVLVVTGSLANLLMALLYNLLGGVVGGLKVVLVQVRNKPKK